MKSSTERKAALGAVNLLVEHSAQAGRVEAEAPFLRAVVRVEVELPGGVPVDMAVETGDAEARLAALAVIGRIEFLLRQRRQQNLQAVELDRGQDILEQTVKVIDRDNLTARDIAELWTVLQEDGRRELGQKSLGQVELDIEPLEPWKHVDLQIREDLAAVDCWGCGSEGYGKCP